MDVWRQAGAAGLVVLTVAVGAGEARAQAGGAPGGKTRLEQLAWLAGSWVSDSAGVRSEEHWMTPRGGLMVGMSRMVADSRVRSFEFLRIRERGDTIAYLASPGGRPATAFTLVHAGENRVTFENAAHDFPQRILYWKEGDRLRARVEGTLEGRQMSEDYAWRRVESGR